MTAVAFRCEHLTVRLGGREVLSDLCWEAPRGAFLILMGPNGSGKSTLLKSVAGLLRPSSGKVISDFRSNPPAYLDQTDTIDPLAPLTLRQVVASGAYRQAGWRSGPLPKPLAAEVEGLMERLGLAAEAGRMFHELSGGIRRKALLARAVVTAAEVLLLDEPAAGLDEESETTVFDLLRNLAGSGKTVVVVHHGPVESPLLSDAVLWLEHGRLSLRTSGGAA